MSRGASRQGRAAHGAHHIQIKEEKVEGHINADEEERVALIAAPPVIRLVTSKTGQYPDYTDVFLVNNRINLTIQSFEMKCTVRNAIQKVLASIIFVDAYPSHAVCEDWGHNALLESAAELRMNAVKASVQECYHNIRQRLKGDVEYWKQLAKLVRINIFNVAICNATIFQSDARISLHRNNLKSYCVGLVVGHYSLTPGCDERVRNSVSKMAYIYPVNDKVSML